ncbi:MAG: hypothetical protein FD127_4444 [Acidimicrobiaceae bacterium]|nr:MAG: hypothetical protein FD127_4444 [Acidimicrobiaceae bacterium]
MQIAHAEAEVIGVPWDAARLTLPLEHGHPVDTTSTQLDGCRQPRWPATDDDHVIVHRLGSHPVSAQISAKQ